MKVVITGATSFLGNRYLGVALTKGWDIIAVVRKNSSKTQNLYDNPQIKVVELDMSEYGRLGSIVGDVDCLVHFAWNGTRGKDRDDEQIQKKNYECTMQLIKNMVNQGCKKVITAGSQAEYGLVSGVVTEDTHCRPNTQYGIYKLKVFNETKEFCAKKGVSYKEPRIFSIYGPGDYENSLIMSNIKRMQANQPCDLTSCVQEWDYLFVDDAIDALISITERECLDGAYNLGSGNVRPLKEYVCEMKEILNSDSDLNFGSVPYGQAGMVSIHPSIDKLSKEIAWKVATSFKDGITRII